MFKRVASWVDRRAVRALFGAIASLAVVLLGPFALMLLAVGVREPWLFLAGLCGIVGLLGGVARIWLGSRFFTLARWPRIVIAAAISAGIAATVFAASGLPGNLYWATVAPLVGVCGLILLAGSIAGYGPGPNNSSKPTPFRGAA